MRETANMISFCADAIGIRDDMYLGAGNAYMREVGAALDDGYKQGVLPQRPALVNCNAILTTRLSQWLTSHGYVNTLVHWKT